MSVLIVDIVITAAADARVGAVVVDVVVCLLKKLCMSFRCHCAIHMNIGYFGYYCCLPAAAAAASTAAVFVSEATEATSNILVTSLSDLLLLSTILFIQMKAKARKVNSLV